MTDSMDKKPQLLLEGPGEYKLTADRYFGFPERKSDHLRLDNILTYVNSLNRPTPVEIQKIEEERGKFRTSWEIPFPNDHHLGDLYYAEILRNDLQENLSLAFNCFNHTPLPEPIPPPNGSPASAKREEIFGHSPRDEKIRVVAKHAIEAGRLEAVDAILAFFELHCRNEYAKSRAQYSSTGMGSGKNTEPISPLENKMITGLGYNLKDVINSRDVQIEKKRVLNNTVCGIMDLRAAIRRFYPPSQGFLIESMGEKDMTQYPWEELSDKLKGETPDIQQAFITLGITPTDHPKAIKEAYRAAVFSTHPDHGGSAKEFQAVIDAYQKALTAANSGLIDPNFFKTNPEEPEPEIMSWREYFQGRPGKPKPYQIH